MIHFMLKMNDYYGATGMTGGIGYTGMTGTGFTGTGMTGVTGFTGTGMTGMTVGLSNATIHKLYKYAGSEYMGNETKESEITECRKRFFDYLIQIFNEEEKYSKESKAFFHLDYQMKFDLPMNPPNLFYHFLTYFYLNRQEDQIYLWLRMEKTIRRIKLQPHSGSIYLNPFDYDQLFLFVGQDDFEHGVYISEKSLSIDKLTTYYMHRTRSYCVHLISEKLFEKNTCQTPLYPCPSTQSCFENILSGLLSDEKIECKDGEIHVSKTLLSQTSNYFMNLFTNTKFLKQEKYSLDFPKDILIEYLRFKCKLKIKKVEMITELLEFASYIQDQSFIQGIYEFVYEEAEQFTTKSLLELRKVFESFGY